MPDTASKPRHPSHLWIGLYPDKAYIQTGRSFVEMDGPFLEQVQSSGNGSVITNALGETTVEAIARKQAEVDESGKPFVFNRGSVPMELGQRVQLDAVLQAWCNISTGRAPAFR